MLATEINVMPPQREWESPSKHPRVAKDEVSVWRVSVLQTESQLARLRDLLASDETARVARFHFEEDRRRAIVSRGILRILLGRELSESPHRIQFSYGPQGKPELATEWAASGLRFNVSHSHEEILVALSRERAIGVDIERIRPDIHDDEISSRYFTPAECASLRSFPPSQRTEGFFAYWTCKEALIKAKGGGVSIPLDAFEVAVDLQTESVPVHIFSPAGSPEDWSICRLPAPAGYTAAIAAAGNNWNLRCWQWNSAAELT